MTDYDTPGKSNFPTDGTDAELITDGGTEGAVDHDYDDAERDPQTVLVENRMELVDEQGMGHDSLSHPDVAIDLVTRQAVYILGTAASTLPEYYEQEDFDLYNYKMHPYLPVRLDDSVYECVYVGDVQDLHSCSGTYDFPAGRLARAPVDAPLMGGDA